MITDTDPMQFERGTISYSLTATLTRPTTMAPTISCDRRVVFQDVINVAHIPPPKPQEISLEPVTKRSKKKSKTRRDSSDPVPDTPSSSGSRSLRSNPAPSSDRSLSERRPPSLEPRERTSVSADATNAQRYEVVDGPSALMVAHTGRGGAADTRISPTTSAINASIQLSKAGLLPGDPLSLRLLVNHIKPNLRGLVIATLYRQGRIDMHPSIPVVSKSKSKHKGKRAEYEDVYPRSKTGLGGLNFSSNAPSSVFRKDLCQDSAMMTVDPCTLTAEVRSMLRIPDDAFSTMNNVPGGMIEFKYFVEVVVDLYGQLGESRFLPRVSLTSPTQMFTNGHGSDNGAPVTSRWADNILDTARLRRSTNVVVAIFEILVGSQDSSRAVTKPRATQREDGPASLDMNGLDQAQAGDESACLLRVPTPNLDHRSARDLGELGPYQHPHALPLHLVPPLRPDEDVDEKTQMQRHEALLLPSRPPDDDLVPVGSSPRLMAASAPILSEEQVLHESQGTISLPHDSSSVHPLRSRDPLRRTDTTVPPYTNTSSLPSNGGQAYSMTDDKQEAERQRLMLEASAPSPVNDEERDHGFFSPNTVPPSSHAAGPSAPRLTEEDEYDAHLRNGDDYGGSHGADDVHPPQYWPVNLT